LTQGRQGCGADAIGARGGWRIDHYHGTAIRADTKAGFREIGRRRGGAVIMDRRFACSCGVPAGTVPTEHPIPPAGPRRRELLDVRDQLAEAAIDRACDRGAAGRAAALASRRSEERALS
jgi:hypothetical protein